MSDAVSFEFKTRTMAGKENCELGILPAYMQRPSVFAIANRFHSAFLSAGSVARRGIYYFAFIV